MGTNITVLSHSVQVCKALVSIPSSGSLHIGWHGGQSVVQIMFVLVSCKKG